MKALTVRQPWAWAMFYADPLKDIENRDWYTNFKGRIALHAAKGMTKYEYQGACQYIRDRTSCRPLLSELVFGAIIGTIEIIGCVNQSESAWFEGDYGFLLRNPIRLPEPIPCRGALGFWDVPLDIEQAINEQLKRDKL